jgi:hypothetical protein
MRIGDRLVLVVDGRARDVPPVPARLRGAITQVDVLAVEAEALVEAAELLEHRATEQQEAAEHPVGLDGLRRPLVQVVVPALHPVRVGDEPDGVRRSSVPATVGKRRRDGWSVPSG